MRQREEKDGVENPCCYSRDERASRKEERIFSSTILLTIAC